MHAKREWTEAEDALIIHLRETELLPWDGIAPRLGVARDTVIQRAKALGLNTGDRRTIQEDGRSRDPLPPGHPTTWGAITQGTSLDGAPYR